MNRIKYNKTYRSFYYYYEDDYNNIINFDGIFNNDHYKEIVKQPYYQYVNFDNFLLKSDFYIFQVIANFNNFDLLLDYREVKSMLNYIYEILYNGNVQVEKYVNKELLIKILELNTKCFNENIKASYPDEILIPRKKYTYIDKLIIKYPQYTFMLNK